MSQSAIVAEGVVRTFGPVRALDGIDLEVRRGPFSGCWARTAPARQPRSGSSRPCSDQTRAGRGSGDTTWCASHIRSAA